MKNLNYYENEGIFDLGWKYNIQKKGFLKERLIFFLPQIQMKAWLFENIESSYYGELMDSGSDWAFTYKQILFGKVCIHLFSHLQYKLFSSALIDNQCSRSKSLHSNNVWNHGEAYSKQLMKVSGILQWHDDPNYI